MPASSPTVMAASPDDGGEPASSEITAADRNIISALPLHLYFESFSWDFRYCILKLDIPVLEIEKKYIYC